MPDIIRLKYKFKINLIKLELVGVYLTLTGDENKKIDQQEKFPHP